MVVMKMMTKNDEDGDCDLTDDELWITDDSTGWRTEHDGLIGP